ncbi:1-(5-phosphoribosyl)-5-[(5-phosphoribosylamino)methylideneamino]imidazole-4-carboxamide isomerase [Alphaproteobacteria bacterium]|jgi:phosphoribosylformimino-5-aminoimidazole carboxamide ribotide isomerase|nr:1-(5-phosphoribosyl)-5-[(5-phosphoribosylamino)methylideneamino]imidazole-4-carboxamide isomerase [Alphaproteobacteria bacterium]MDB9872875.1 1-(5-phosphoribosyl)-5-[(5-phosphoribosylamino)methylideneamino]imidazole-4-carboxamide isomerase [Alphaproteobacteria bacterium]
MNKNFTLYPAIDIKNGKCVRLLFGDMNKETIYGDNPLDQAMWFLDQGAEWLHIVDLDGAVRGENINKIAILKILKKLQNKIKVQIGGGIRDLDQMDYWLQNHVDRVILGTAALENPDLIINLDKKYFKKIVIGTDVRNGMIASHGWKTQSKVKAVDLIKKFNPDIIDSIIYTDISRDGSLKGVNLKQTLNFAKSILSPVIASGGIFSLNEILQLRKEFSNGIEGVIIGRALYDKKFTFTEALNLIKKEL